MVEIEPCCVLDFYVHEAAQRGGIGGQLFHHFLAAETQVPARLAYDRPSPKLLAFLAKRFHLRAHKPQNNNYVVFRDYWRVGPRPASAAKAAMKEMGGRGGLAAAARAKAAAARAAAAEERRFAGGEFPVVSARRPPPRFAKSGAGASAGPRAPPTPPRIEPARGSSGTDDLTARPAVGSHRAFGDAPFGDAPFGVARPPRRFADRFADAVDARVGHVSDVRSSNQKATRGNHAEASGSVVGASASRAPDWKTAETEAVPVGRSSDESGPASRFLLRPSPPSAPRGGEPPEWTRRARRDLTLKSGDALDTPEDRPRSPRKAPPRDSFPSQPVGDARESWSETLLLSPNARRVAGSDQTELRKRVDERLREHPYGVDTGTVESSEPGLKYAEFVRRLRAMDGRAGFRGGGGGGDAAPPRDPNARGEYGQVAYPAPGYYRARAPERPLAEAPVYHYRRSDAPWLPEGAVTRRYDGGVGMWRAKHERWGAGTGAGTTGTTGTTGTSGTGADFRGGGVPTFGDASASASAVARPRFRRAENEWFTYGEGQDAYWRGRARFDAARRAAAEPPRAPIVASARARAANAKRFESDVVRYGREAMARSRDAWDG